jgi:hypothetical protein
MNRNQWRDLQRALHPKDLESVQRFAEKLASDEPFVFVFDGRLSFSLDGPGIAPLAGDLIGTLTQDLELPPQLAGLSPSSMQ